MRKILSVLLIAVLALSLCACGGAGKNAVTFAREGMRVLLIDVSDRMLEYSRTNLGEMADDCEFDECDFASAELALK